MSPDIAKCALRAKCPLVENHSSRACPQKSVTETGRTSRQLEKTRESGSESGAKVLQDDSESVPYNNEEYRMPCNLMT